PVRFTGESLLCQVVSTLILPMTSSARAGRGRASANNKNSAALVAWMKDFGEELQKKNDSRRGFMALLYPAPENASSQIHRTIVERSPGDHLAIRRRAAASLPLLIDWECRLRPRRPGGRRRSRGWCRTCRRRPARSGEGRRGTWGSGGW